MNERRARNFERDTSHASKKPSHVRKLNFGRTILTLDAVERLQGQKNGVLTIDRNVGAIPCTEKSEYVRKWIEIHNSRALESDGSSQSSPILGSLVTKRAVTSPIFGNRRKRIRGRNSLNNHSIVNSEHGCSSNERNRISQMSPDCSIGNRYRKGHAFDKKENIRRNLFNAKSNVTSSKVSNPNISPVLAKNAYSYKRRRRKLEEENLQRRALDRIENKIIEVCKSPPISTMTRNTSVSPIFDKNADSYKCRKRKPKKSNYLDTNMNSVISRDLISTDNLESKCKIMCSQKQLLLLQKLENNFKNNDLQFSVNKDPKIMDESMSSDSPVSETKINIEDSPKDMKEVAKMEIEFSNEDSNNTNGNVNINSDTDKDLSDRIEDDDTQDGASKKIFNCGLKHNTFFLACKSTATSSQLSNTDTDTDQTFFSKGEKFQSTSSVHPSQKISQISSQVNNCVDDKSSQTGIFISIETSPQKMISDPSMQLNLLDSGKKRKKPKRGSLVERLQSTINRQTSFVRIWRHKFKQSAKDSTPFVTIYIRACVTRFSRQFLEGIAVEDPFGLLPHKQKNNSSRSIRIMTIPDIVGKVEMKSRSIIQIFPPWEVLDDKEPILNVTYIHIASNHTRANIEKCEKDIKHVEQTIVKEFECPCIRTGKNILTCKDRFGKPNVIEKLFIEY